jgi:hypothetical protein
MWGSHALFAYIGSLKKLKLSAKAKRLTNKDDKKKWRTATN